MRVPGGDLRPRRRRRPRPRRRRPLPRARGQPAHALRRQLRAREPAGAEADLRAALRRSTTCAPIDDYPRALLETLRSVAPRAAATRAVVLLTPGRLTTRPTSSTRSSRGRWASSSSRARDLVVHRNRVFMRTTRGLQRVDVIYRRIDDDFLDPLAFRGDSLLGVAGPAQRLPRRQRRARQRDRHGRRRRQGDLPVRAGDDPLLPRRGADPGERADLPRDRRRRPRATSSSTSTSWSSRRSTERAATGC